MSKKKPNVLELLRDSHNLLDGHLGDTDFDACEDEEEEREYAPVQVAARQIMQAIQMLEKATGATP